MLRHPAQPPKEALEVRRKRANDGDHYHAVANPAKKKGYRPGRKTQQRQTKPGRASG